MTNFAKPIDISLIGLHAVFCEMKVSGVFIELLLILWHLFDHHGEVLEARLVSTTGHSPFGVDEFFHLFRHLL